MRSRSCAMDGPDDQPTQASKDFIDQQETPELAKQRKNIPKDEKDVTTDVCGSTKKTDKAAERRKAKTPDLSKMELIQLLGIMEGEVQAREDIIGLLKSEKTRTETLEAHYGSAASTKALQALQRDKLLLNCSSSTQDVYEKPMAELDRLEEKQNETYRRMLEQLLLAEKCHRRTVMELDNEKRKHADFINKSDDFTNLLEHERERLKRLLEQEKSYQARKEKEHNKKLENVRAELIKLKSFTLMLVDERHLNMEQMDQQNQKIKDLTQKLQEKEQRLAATCVSAKEHDQKVLKLEAELEQLQVEFHQKQEEIKTKLTNQEVLNQQQRLKMDGLVNKLEQLEETNKELQKSELDLQQLREKINKGECGNSSLVAELENLRKKVLEMEGKDEEIMKTETQCRELRKKLQEEGNHSKEVKLEVDKLQKRMSELEKLEGIFNKSKAECSQLHTNLEKERKTVKDLACELEKTKAQLKVLESSGIKLEKVEIQLKDDLKKLKSFTVLLAEERRTLAERLKHEKQKNEDINEKLEMEQSKVTDVTEKLIEESKKLLKLKSEMEMMVTVLTQEKEELENKLVKEKKNCEDLNTQLGVMKGRIDGLEDTMRERRWDWNQGEDNKVKELTLETERLRSRLEKLEIVEGDLMKTEDEYDLLEKKFRTEQDKADSLAKQVEDMKTQIAKNKAIEKGEVASPEAELRLRCKIEEAKTSQLRGDVHALKEKVHELMNKEDQLSQLKVNFSILQQRFIEEEEKKRSMAQQIENLTKELEATKRYSRVLRPGMNGRRMVDVPVTSTAVQTDVLTTEPAEEDTAAGFIRKSFLEEKNLMSNLRLNGLKKAAVLDRYPPAATKLEMRKSSLPWMMTKQVVSQTQTSSERSLSPKAGQPLHIRVMPDHLNSTATLEITSPRAEDFYSSTTIIPTLGLQQPRITIVPKPTTVSGGLERSKSPVTITTICRGKSPETKVGSCGLQSPVSIITVSTTPVAEACAASDPHDLPTGRTVITVTPDRRPDPAPVRKYNGNIITTEDNKIHIHLGSQPRRPEVCSGSVLTLRPGSESMPSGRSPWDNSTVRTSQSKMTSSITITPMSSAISRPMPSALSSDGGRNATTTRIPGGKGDGC